MEFLLIAGCLLVLATALKWYFTSSSEDDVDGEIRP